MNKRTYTDQQLKQAITSSFSMRQTMRKLGLKIAGGSQAHLKKLIQKLNIDTSHFTGMLWNKGIKFGPKYKIEQYLSNQRSIKSHDLRLRLLEEKIFPYQCSSCLFTEWSGVPIPLELDHIDGDHENNDLSNLRLLCPNCHAMTNTYAGRNKK